VARMKPGVEVEHARAEMAGIGADIERERPDFNAGWSTNVFPLQEDLTGNVRQALWVLLGAVSLVLLIACANVASLLLSRAAVREKEFAIRAALGAGRARLAQLVLVESLLLGLVGGALGLGVAYLGLDALLAILPTEVPSLIEIRVDPRVLAYTFLVSLASGVLFGLVPALQGTRETGHGALKEGRSPGGSTRQRVRQALVVSEIALALMLLVGAGLLMRSFFRLRSVDPGFNPTGLLTLQLSLSGARDEEDAARITQFYQEVLERFGTVPGAVSAGAMSWLPLGGPGSATSFKLMDRPEPPAGESPTGEVRIVQGDLFRTMGIPLRRGRVFEARDRADSPKVVVINETLANLFWPGQDPLGKRLAMSWGEDIQAEIIGVVGDVRLNSLNTAPRSTLYWAQPQLRNEFMTFMVRTRSAPLELAGALRAQVHALDPQQPVANVQTMEEVLSRSLNQPRFTVTLLGVFAAVALLLALVGIYGVISYLVSQRRHEIGVRMALGARASDILRMILTQGAWLAGVGIALGLAGAFATARYLESLLFNLPATDPLTFAGISVLLATVALVASFVPARRATRVDPMVALHYE